MIILDASSIVGAALVPGSVPDQAFRRVIETDVFALSSEVETEIVDVLHRPKFAARLRQQRIDMFLNVLRSSAVWFRPTTLVSDCRDQKDNKYLELALVAEADAIISSDNHLLTLNPWRGVRIVRPSEYLAE